MNNFIGEQQVKRLSTIPTIHISFILVGQVTPSMLTHLGFGTFVFFGVSAFHVILFRGAVESNFKFPKSFSLLGGLFVMFFVGPSFSCPT